MTTETTLDRCAAYVAARAALAEIQRTVERWPSELADHARLCALATVMTTADSVDHAPTSAGRRRCVRAALAAAIELSTAFEIARALGHGDAALDRASHDAGRTIAMLGLYLHASETPALVD